MIEDSLFLRNDSLDKKIIVTCSSKPNAELKVSELTHFDTGKGGKLYQFSTLAQSREELGVESFKCLSNNPMNNDFICSSGLIHNSSDDAPTHQESGVLIWKIDQSILGHEDDQAKKGGPNKRVKPNSTIISPNAKIPCSGGISTMKWSGPTKIFAGCYDHSLKLINVDRL